VNGRSFYKAGIARCWRVCVLRKSEHAIQQAHRRLERKASKKQTKTKPETLEYAKYVIVFTTQPTAAAGQILEWYRLRWQIELVFKRLKTLAQLAIFPSTTSAVLVLGSMESCSSRY